MASAGPRELASKLYDACLNQFEPDHLFNQHDLLSLDVIPKNDLGLLMECAQELVNQKLLRLLQDKSERLSWQIIPREDAEKSVSPLF